MTRIFVAGAMGAVGRRLIPILLANGFVIAGTTRDPDRAQRLREAGVEPVIVDVFKRDELFHAVEEFSPEVVVHQLTDLPKDLDPQQMREGIERNAKIRMVGTRNLLDAAVASGAKRFVAQSIAWAYAPGTEPHVETDPLDIGATEPRSVSVGGVVALEEAALGAKGMISTVLRYAHIYGPGTGADKAPNDRLSVHVDAAAYAAYLGSISGSGGIYNIAENDGAVTSEKARRDLGWSADFRLHEKEFVPTES